MKTFEGLEIGLVNGEECIDLRCALSDMIPCHTWGVSRTAYYITCVIFTVVVYFAHLYNLPR